MAADSHAAEAQPRGPIPLAGKLWLAGAVLMVLASVMAVFATGRIDSMATVAIGSVEGVERLGGIDIPDSARLVNARMRSSMVDLDPMAWAIIDLPRADARAMLRRSPLVDPGGDRAKFSDDWGQFGGERIEGWHPDAAGEWLSAWIGDDRPEFWHVIALADLDREPARVYLLLER